jgi:cell wall-associated NlpC family hydrolase
MRGGRLGAVALVVALGCSSLAAVSAARTTRSSTCATVGSGAVGPAVAVLQRKVGVGTDGDFGPMTAAAVKAAQSKAKLRPSGKAGPATWAALGLTGTPACMTVVHSAGQKQAAADARAQQAIHDEVVKLAATLTGALGRTTNAVAAAAMTFARGQAGKPYRWGGAGPASYDCSGLVMSSYLAAGITLPRVAADQYGAGSLVRLDQARQGDLLFYASDLTRPSTIYHVVLYAGRGRVLDAPHAGAVVGTRALWTAGLLPVAARPVGQLRLPLRPGARGWSVAQLQQALNRHGAKLSVDGGFGGQTAAAVRGWKAAHDLAGTAKVGVRAWLTLGTSPGATPKR